MTNHQHGWHASPELLRRYADGTLAVADAASIDTHLPMCATCRAGVAPFADTLRLDGIWHGIVDVVDAPRIGVVERLLRALGVRRHVARLLSATPSLSVSWFAAVAIVLGFALVASSSGQGGDAVFLFLAPLVPVAGVGLAYGSGIDPAYELGKATPMGAFRLLLYRATAVIGASILVCAAASVGVPGGAGFGLEWLLPALGLSIGTLALGSFVAPTTAAAVVSGAWAAGLLAYARIEGVAGEGLSRAVADAPAFDPSGQLVFLVGTLAAALIVALRQGAVELGRNA